MGGWHAKAEHVKILYDEVHLFILCNGKDFPRVSPMKERVLFLSLQPTLTNKETAQVLEMKTQVEIMKEQH